jgi:UDP-N-acetylmuramoyl-tripeptide--D-alanyl-D-alanine ligase
VIEMGANHVGENEELCLIAEPNLGIVTNNGLDHLEGFGSIEGVAKSNSELYYYLFKNGGCAFVNANDEWLMRMSARLTKIITYAANTPGRQAEATYTGQAEKLQPGIQFTFEERQGTSVLSGDYNFDNIMAAISIGKFLDVETEQVLSGVQAYHPSNNRSQWISKESNLIFMDAYNANPSSMEVALKNFAQTDRENKVVIMGDMFEMGSYAKAEHQRMVDLCHSLNFKHVILVGNEFGMSDAGAYVKCATTEKAREYLVQYPVKESAVFIKGSRGMRLESLLDVID